MKIFGNSKRSKHCRRARSRDSAKSGGSGGKTRKKAWMTTGQRAAAIALAVLAVIAVGAVVLVKTQVKPPPVVEEPNDPTPSGPNSGDSSGDVQPNIGHGSDTPNGSGGEPGKTLRREGVYTFLAMGRDKISGSTDTIMLASFDTTDHSLNIVSIPRDTLVNVPWGVKKINTLYGYQWEDDEFLQGYANFLGFRPDFYGVIDLNAFIKLVDAIGGVDYYVPQDMDYDDPAQDLHIHFSEGQQRLDGQKAMEYMRFRSGYDDQDIGRIHAQQSFLTAAAQQILADKGSIPIATIIDIFMNDVRTSLDIGECGWFAKELLKLDFANIHFYIMPGNYNDWAFGASYVTVTLDAWIEMVNEYLNPFDQDLTVDNFDILTRDSDNQLYATSGVIQRYN